MEEILLFLFHVCGLIISCEIEEQGRVGSTKTCLGKFGELKLISQIFFFSSAELKSQKKNGFSSNIVINLSLCMFICHKSYITGTKKKKSFHYFSRLITQNMILEIGIQGMELLKFSSELPHFYPSRVIVCLLPCRCWRCWWRLSRCFAGAHSKRCAEGRGSTCFQRGGGENALMKTSSCSGWHLCGRLDCLEIMRRLFL